MTCLRYSPDIETLETDEQQTIDGIIKGMTQQTETGLAARSASGRGRFPPRDGRVFGEHDVMFELKVQPWANAETQPIEDASIEWPAQDSQYRTVATIRPPRQAATARNGSAISTK